MSTTLDLPAAPPLPLPAVPFAAAVREASVRAKTLNSRLRHERAARTLAGGVSSGLRRTARPYPLYYSHGEGARVVDVDGNAYRDYTLAWGPLILGHAPPEVADAVAAQARRGLTFGAQHDLEYEVAERLVATIPCADLVAYANSGTEIVQVALRLARAVTGRARYLKFEGHYHGWDDSVLVSYQLRRDQFAEDHRPVPVGLGQVPNHTAVVVEWNRPEQVEEAFARHGHELSAILCEPMLCNNGCIAPEPGFLERLREIATTYGALLIFDEVITGFRLALGGAQERYGVTPDLATYAKAVGAGTPLSVLAGRARWMERIAKGEVVHAGTLNGNPLSLAAAKVALDVLARDAGAAYAGLHRRGERLRRGLEQVLRARGLTVTSAGAGPVFQLSFMERPARTYRDTLAADRARYSDFALALLDEGVLVLPDGRWYLSLAHTDDDVAATLDAATRAAGA